MLYECVRALWRRRLLSVLAVIVSLGVAAAVFSVVKPMHQSTAQVLFVPSVRQPEIDGPTNPFLSLGGSVAIVASIVQAQVSDDRTAGELEQAGDTATYTVTPNLTENAGPVLLLDVSDPSVTTVTTTLAAVIKAIQTNLRTLQENQGVRPMFMVTSVVLTSSPEPLVVRKTQIKAAIVALVAMIALLTSVILLVERRRILASPRRKGSGHRARQRPTATRPERRATVDSAAPASPPKRASAPTRT